MKTLNLIIDIGNSYCKIAVFDNQEITQKFKLKTISYKALKEKINLDNISRCLISSTRNKPEELIADLSKYFKCLWLSNALKLPFTNKYATPETLGKDRLALTAAASLEFKNQNALIIDVGTCITYDFKNSKNEYLGGAISPGLEMRFKSLNHFTHGLPLVETRNMSDFIGNSTKNNIESGVINGISLEIDGVINQYHKRFAKLNVILTGGDQLFFAECLKNNFFARPDFLVKGLNYLAEINA